MRFADLPVGAEFTLAAVQQQRVWIKFADRVAACVESVLAHKQEKYIFFKPDVECRALPAKGKE